MVVASLAAAEEAVAEAAADKVMEVKRETLPASERPDDMNLELVCVESFDALEIIRQDSDSEHVDMGDCLRLDENTSAYTVGANPCISGVVETKDGELYLFHSLADLLSKEQAEVVRNSRWGMVGGGWQSLDGYTSLFQGANIKVIWPPNFSSGSSSDPGSDFNIVVVGRGDKSGVKPGVYYCYEEIECRYDRDESWDNS